MSHKAKIFPVGLMIAGLAVLFNPNLSILDPIPDAIGYALILFSLRHLATFAPYMGNAADAFRKLFYISLAKIPALLIMVSMGSQRITLTVFSLSFAVLELLFLFPAFQNLFEGFFYLGSRFGCSAAIAEEPRKPDAIRSMTYVFFSVKMALSTLPDFLFLFEYDPLSGKGFTITTAQYLLVLLIAFLATLIVGIIWLSYILPYLRAIKREQAESPLLSQEGKAIGDAVTMPDGDVIVMKESRRLRISLPYFLFAMGLCLSPDIVIDYSSILPDYLAGLSFLAVAILLLLRKGRFAKPAAVLSVCYTLLSVLYSVFRERFYSQFAESDLTRVPAADAAYLPIIITSALAEILFILTVFFLLRALAAFKKEMTPSPTPRTELERKYLAEDEKGERKQTAVLFTFASLSAILSFLNVILMRATTAVPMQPGYGGTLYLPRAGAFWLIALVFAVAAAVYGSYLSSTRVSEMRCAIEEAEPTSDPAL